MHSKRPPDMGGLWNAQLECIFKFLSDCRNEELTFALAGPTDKISSGYLSVRRSKYEQEQEGVSEASDSI